MIRLLLGLSPLLLSVASFAAQPEPATPPPAPSDLVLPDVLPAPTPRPPAPPPSAVLPLPADCYYLAIASDKPWFVLASPAGLVTVTQETGPMRIRGRFADAPDKVVTRVIVQKYIVLVEAAGTGQCELIAFPSGVTDAKQVARRLVDVNVGPRPPPVPPGPVPPGPTPGPAPIPGDGLRVLVVYESADLTKYPASQVSALYSADLRDYLNSHCAKGPDGKTAEYRIWDQNVSTVNESKTWQDAMKRNRAELPWIVISNGRDGYEGPLPKTKDELLKLLKTYGGN